MFSKMDFVILPRPDDSTGNAKLSTQPLPELDKIAKDPEFEPVEITQEEFEDVWKKRRYTSL